MTLPTVTLQRDIPPRAWAELLLLAALWGGSFLGNRLALNDMGVFTAVALRVSGAMFILWAYVLIKGLPLPRNPRVWAAFLVMGILNNVLPFSLISWGQLTIPSGLAAILNAATAIFGVLAASLFFRDERLTRAKALGVILGFAGVVTIIGPSALAGLDLTSLAQLALVAAAVSYALAAVWGRTHLSGLPPQVAAAGMLTGSSLVMVPLAITTEGLPSFSYGLTAWGAIIYLAIASTAFAYLLYYRVLALAGAGNLSLVTLLVVPFAIVLGALVLGESLPARDYLGFLLLALGLLVIDGRIPARMYRIFFA
jgi:drug/metabolite transporter (DMT)-like permease